MFRRDRETLKLLPSKMTLGIYMFGAAIKFGIVNKVDGRLIVTMQGGQMGLMNIDVVKKSTKPNGFFCGSTH